MSSIYLAPIDSNKASKYLFDLATNYNQSLKSSLDALATALVTSNTSNIYSASILVCGNTREASFGSDFAASADFTKLALTETQRALNDTLALFTKSAALLEAAAEKMRALDAELADQISRYCISTNDRKIRLSHLCNNQLYKAFEAMSKELDLNLDLNSLGSTEETQNGYAIATGLQWLTHRLLWIARELSLESGPHFEALEKQLAFLQQQDETVNEIRHKCSLNEEVPELDSKPLNRLRLFVREGSDLHSSLLSDLQSFIAFHVSSNIAQKQEAANKQTEVMRARIIEFMTQLNTLTSPILEFTEVDQSAITTTSRVLLTNADNGPEEWTAANLDFGAVTFGNTQEEALERLAALSQLHEQLPGGRSKRLNKITLRLFETGTPTLFSKFPQFKVNIKSK